MPARATDIRPLVADRILIDPAQIWQLRNNPHIRSIDRIGPAGRLAPGKVLVHVTRAVAAPRPRRRLSVRIELHPPAGLGRALTVLGVTVAVLAVLAATGWLIFVLYGDAITAAVKIVAAVIATFLSVLFVAWAVSLTTGRCPGLHCPGCGHR